MTLSLNERRRLLPLQLGRHLSDWRVTVVSPAFD